MPKKLITVLIGFLISMAMIVPAAWANPPGPVPPGGHVNITKVIVDFDAGEMRITGEHLLFGLTPGVAPVVTLGDYTGPTRHRWHPD